MRNSIRMPWDDKTMSVDHKKSDQIKTLERSFAAFSAKIVKVHT